MDKDLSTLLGLSLCACFLLHWRSLMARNRVACRTLGKGRRAGRIGACSARRSGSEEVHVLAVDDSHVDRKVIERLLKVSSCKGI